MTEVKIYSKDECPWCDRAKELIINEKQKYNEINVGRDMTRDEFMEEFPDVRTLPYIIIDGKPIGGYEALNSYYNLLP